MVVEFLVSDEMSTIVMSSARQSRWCVVGGGVAPHIPNNLHRMCTYLGLHTKFLTGSSRPLFSSLHSVLYKIIKGKTVRHRCDMSQTLV